MAHPINTGEQAPIRSAPHRLAPAWRDKLKEEVRTLLETGIVKPSLSPWSSPMVPVRKPDGTVRLCIDFRRINKATEPDPYQIPLIEDLLDRLGEAKYLSKLDLNKGFYQIPVEGADQPKTAFCTPWGKYEFLRMPFGLRNAPATFQRCMHSVLGGLEDLVDSYIDDLVVFISTLISCILWLSSYITLFGHHADASMILTNSMPPHPLYPNMVMTESVLKLAYQSFRAVFSLILCQLSL